MHFMSFINQSIRDDIQVVSQFPCLLGHPALYTHTMEILRTMNNSPIRVYTKMDPPVA